MGGKKAAATVILRSALPVARSDTGSDEGPRLSILPSKWELRFFGRAASSRKLRDASATAPPEWHG